MQVHDDFKRSAVNTTSIQLNASVENNMSDKKLSKISIDSENEYHLDVVNNDSDLENLNSHTACEDAASNLENLKEEPLLVEEQR